MKCLKNIKCDIVITKIQFHILRLLKHSGMLSYDLNISAASRSHLQHTDVTIGSRDLRHSYFIISTILRRIAVILRTIGATGYH